MSCRSPVLFLVFNRPDTTLRVFEAIRAARPARLYVAADGPRPSRHGEAERCDATRRIATAVDWPCEVITLFRQENLGCKRAVSGAINWFFENEPEGLILEDDCLPDPTFFDFCDELLETYRDDDRIAMISGTTLQLGQKRGEASYYFSRYTHIWGWASWRRAWRGYDSEARLWPLIRDNRLFDGLLSAPAERAYWYKVFQSIYEGKVDTWDYQWVLNCWSQGRISIVPAVNLISNIGFGPEATHTQESTEFSEMKVGAMQWPLTHPKVFLAHAEADAYIGQRMRVPSFLQSVFAKLALSLRSAR